MVQEKTLLDSNAYFRLAYNIHPLLFVEFGVNKYCLYIIEDLMQEFRQNPRLRNKFDWVLDKEFIENRTHPITISNQQKKTINDTCEYIWGMSRASDILSVNTISPVDTKAVATALTLGIKLVSDDEGVQEVSKIYGVDCMSTLSLLKLMLDCKHIDIETVRQVVAYWQYDNDTPNRNFKNDYKALFGENPPSRDYVG